MQQETNLWEFLYTIEIVTVRNITKYSNTYIDYVSFLDIAKICSMYCWIGGATPANIWNLMKEPIYQ